MHKKDGRAGISEATKAVRLIESAYDCLKITEPAIRWVAERLYDVEGQDP